MIYFLCPSIKSCSLTEKGGSRYKVDVLKNARKQKPWPEDDLPC